MEPTTRTLLKKSAADRQVLDAGGLAPAILGFHAQQAAEKLLKALLNEAGAAYPRTHDLVALADLVHVHDPQALPALPVAWPDLNGFAVLYRYDEVPTAEAPDVAQLRATVDSLRVHVEARVRALAAARGTTP